MADVLFSNLSGQANDLLLAIFVVFVRVGTMIMLMPGFSEASVPARIRLIFALALAVMIQPLVGTGLIRTNDPVTLLLGEFIIGLMFGFALRLILVTASVSGTFIAFNIGLGFAQALERGQIIQSAIFASFLRLLALTIIFTAGIHHLMLTGLVKSYQLLQIGRQISYADSNDMIFYFIAHMFSAAVLIAAPFVIFAFVYNLGLGLLARLMPQLQVFFITMPAVILAGMVLIMLFIGAFINHYTNYAADFVRLIFNIG